MLARAEEVRATRSVDRLLCAVGTQRDSDYSSTVTFQEIQVFDRTGNRFYDFYVEDGDNNRIYSGTPYRGAGPGGTVGLIGAGLDARRGLLFVSRSDGGDHYERTRHTPQATTDRTG
jgi:hypothetical protein